MGNQNGKGNSIDIRNGLKSIVEELAIQVVEVSLRYGRIFGCFDIDFDLEHIPILEWLSIHYIILEYNLLVKNKLKINY